MSVYKKRAAKARSKSYVCAKCKVEKQATGFSRDRSRTVGYFPWCKTCVREVKQAAPKRVVGTDGDRKCPICKVGLEGTHSNRRFCSNPCKDRFRRLACFGLTPEEFELLIEDTGGKCPICRKNVKRWEIDHIHSTGVVTGAVCRICNGNLLAYTNHDPEVAKRLVDFLENHPVERLFGAKRYVGPEQVSQRHRMWAWSNENGA